MLSDVKNGCLFSVKVRTERPRTKLVEINDRWLIIDVKSKPIENRANSELVSFLEKILSTKVEIVKGHKSKVKKIFAHNLDSNACAKAFIRALNN
ncbi:MAG: DUF167 family protein [Actinobacteria bacterium]|nr:DUF167 family protein [Actinomycetota bacterium]